MSNLTEARTRQGQRLAYSAIADCIASEVVPLVVDLWGDGPPVSSGCVATVARLKSSFEAGGSAVETVSLEQVGSGELALPPRV
jgi:hypothetical protein